MHGRVGGRSKRARAARLKHREKTMVKAASSINQIVQISPDTRYLLGSVYHQPILIEAREEIQHGKVGGRSKRARAARLKQQAQHH